MIRTWRPSDRLIVGIWPIAFLVVWLIFFVAWSSDPYLDFGDAPYAELSEGNAGYSDAVYVPLWLRALLCLIPAMLGCAIVAPLLLVLLMLFHGFLAVLWRFVGAASDEGRDVD